MTTPANLSEQILALPNGAGAVGSAGQTFQADPYTGTGRFAIPIEVQPGHAGLAPALALTYSTHGGNGIAGLGWSLGLASVARRIDKGIPSYASDEDTFTLQGDELLPVGGDHYRLRIETRFARVRHVREGGRDFWVVTERDGTRVLYGLDPDHRLHAGPGRIADWYASKKQDAQGNEVLYDYVRDASTRDVRLSEVTWAGCYRVRFTYEARPDPISSSRAGFVHTTDQRLSRIDVEVRRTSTGAFATYRTYALTYATSSWTGRSLLQGVTVTGTDPDGATHTLPPLSFGYVDPDLADKRWHDVTGAVPGSSLAERTVTLVHQSGSGLPDLLETTPTGHRLRENLGEARFDVPRLVASPAQVGLDQPGTFLSDMSGDGWADLVVAGGARVYRGAPGGGWSAPYASAQAPSVDLDDPRVRLADLTGDGMPDALYAGPSGWQFFRNLGEGRWAPPVRLLRPPPVRLDDPRVHLADLSGDGLADLVFVEGKRLLVWPALGFGQFGEALVVENPLEVGPTFEPRAVRFADVTGSGQADLLYVRAGRADLCKNLGGRRFGAPVLVGVVAQSSQGHVEPIDLLGTGAEGLLFTDRQGGPSHWRFLEIFPSGSPDLLSRIDNGLGATTTLSYTSSASHWARDWAAGRRWKTAMPSAQRVVDTVTTTDTVTGNTLGVAYRYRHGVYDGLEREFRGFAVVDQIDVEAPKGDPQPLSQVLARRFYHTGRDVEVRDEYAPLPRPAVDDEVPDLPWALRSLRGQLHREETFALDGNPKPYVVTEVGYRVFPVQRTPGTQRCSFSPLEVRRRVTHTERTADHRVVETTTTWDLHGGRGYGLPVEVRERGYGRRGAFSTPHEQQQQQDLERYTRTSYVRRDEPGGSVLGAYTPTYLVDRPSLVERYGVTGQGEVLLSRERRFYDGDTFQDGEYKGLGYPGTGTTAGVVRGRLSCRLVLAFPDGLVDDTFPQGSGAAAALDDRGQFLDDGGDLYVHAERYAYDATTGMVVGAKDPNGNTATFEYDATYDLFPVLFTDAASHPTALTRGEFPHQVAVVVDANDDRTEFTYDPSGLPASKAVMGKYVAGAWQGDPPSDPTEQYTYDFTTTPVRIVVKTRQVRLGATFDVSRYVDGLGRTIQERHTAEPDPASPSTPRWRVTGWQVFNHKGLVVKANQPTFDDTDDYGPGDTTTPFVETHYDPLGRPVRVDYPDGTFETTTYGPWVQAFFDRNDNGEGVTDARYDPEQWSDHWDTPTKKYVDAFGREIAVAEDAGELGSATPTFRTTTYEIRSGEFTGTSYDLVLENPLSAHYFVMISGSVDVSGPAADNVGVRVTQDPFGTGSLAASSAANVLRLERGASDVGDWQGTVSVWECLGDEGASGFTLVDVLAVSAAAEANPGGQTTNATANTAWTALSRVALCGGPRGGGSTLSDGAAADWPSLSGKLVPSGTDAVALTRHGGSQPLKAATFTVYVVQWGTEHTVQRVTVSGSAGGAGADATGEYDTANISQVTRANTWCWFSGTTETDGENEAFSGLVLALGDGVSQNATETAVAVGGHHAVTKDCLVTVHSHPALAVDWRFKALGDGGASTLDYTVDDAAEPESEEEYLQGGSDNPKATRGRRVPLHTNTGPGTGDTYDGSLFLARHTAQDTLTAERLNATDTWAAWVQSVDTLGVTFTPRRPHTTRSVLDLKDQVVEVHDARDLGFATWEFTYDLAGRRTVSAHATALGTRYALADAAGNPIWSGDARTVEVDRTFDVLNRPLEESSTVSSTTKRRRKWSYVAYDPQHADFATFQSKNLFGRVEEARDADGLRFFEYDWRGLVTRTSHRFWDTTSNAKDWTDPTADFWTTDWDPEVVDTARGSVSSWLSLDNLTDTTTVVVSTTYDAAGRPVEVSYPEGMKTRATYNAAGQLDQVEVDRGAGAGWQVVVEDLAYNARGQVTAYTHGNGVETSREYDADLERLTRIYTTLPGSPQVDFQDLNTAYDPVGNPLQIEDALAQSQYTVNQIIPNTRTFGYDARYRLVRATGKKHNTVVRKGLLGAIPNPDPNDYVPYTVKYAYDEVGNFTRNQEYAWGPVTYKADRIDLFNGDGTENLDDDPASGNYTYDENGNTLHTPRIAELGYTHDNQARYVDMGGGTELRYLRHADQRVLRFVKKNGVQALGVYVGPWEYHRRIGTTAYTKSVLSVEGHGRHGQAERVLAGSDPDSLAIFYVHTDHLGSGHVLTDDAGDLLSQEEYFPYGSASDRRDARNRYRFIGVERDEDTNLCMTGPRTYDPVLGGFLQGDPIADRRSRVGPFVYGNANPVGRKDPGGYQDTSAVTRTQEEWRQAAEAAKGAVPESALSVVGLGMLVGGLQVTADQLAGIEWASPTAEGHPMKHAASRTLRGMAEGVESFATERATTGGLVDPHGVVERSETLGYYGTFAAQFVGPAALESGLTRLAAGSRTLVGNLASRGGARLLWTSWENYPKVTRAGRVYAQIGERLYAQHAVERMMPRGLTTLGRSVSPNVVEEVIQTGATRTFVQDGVERTAYSAGNVEVITEQGANLIISVNPYKY